jgi:hypothetical protein
MTDQLVFCKVNIYEFIPGLPNISTSSSSHVINPTEYRNLNEKQCLDLSMCY